MKKLLFTVDIDASRQEVWETMLAADTYKEWSGAGWPGSYYEGTWKQGENLRFLAPNMGGSLIHLIEHRPYEYSFAKHIAAINPDGTEDRDSETAKGWIGATESYTFTEHNGKTTLEVEIHTNPAWESMFTDGWPKALAKLKEICER
jgi:uncharacterized protein YndB with AHSA1/START domain